jgi:hypothetical protein
MSHKRCEIFPHVFDPLHNPGPGNLDELRRKLRAPMKIRRLKKGATKRFDPECVALIEAMNRFPGITTVESCSGHGKEPFHIWFTVQSLKDLPALLYWTDWCHTGQYGWRVFVKTDCAMSPVSFCLEGPPGRKGYNAADTIAMCMNEFTQEKPRCAKP